MRFLRDASADIRATPSAAAVQPGGDLGWGPWKGGFYGLRLGRGGRSLRHGLAGLWDEGEVEGGTGGDPARVKVV